MKHTVFFLIVFKIITFSVFANDLSLFNTIKQAGKLDEYLFVSFSMSDQDLIELSAQAQIVKMTLVISGFDEHSTDGLEHTKLRISQINHSCCENKGPVWMIYPQLFERFNIKTVPSFVISKNSNDNIPEFTKISGEMSVQNALKYIYAGTNYSLIKKQAKISYLMFKED